VAIRSGVFEEAIEFPTFPLTCGAVLVVQHSGNTLYSVQCQRVMQRNNIKEFLNKGWGMWGLNKLFKSCKKLARQQNEAAALKAYRIFLVLVFCNIHTQTGYYKKEICH